MSITIVVAYHWYRSMRRNLARIKGLGFIFWHARHEFYHALLGVAWAWVLREVWGEFSTKWLLLSIFASLLPDVEHLFYFLTYGSRDRYTKEIKNFLKTHQWRTLTIYIEHGHKQNTELSYHNIYVILFLFILAFICFVFDWNTWVVVFGAMITHYIFDILDDIVTLGYINPNWKRWGNGRKKRG